jgi:hypothetical protein
MNDFLNMASKSGRSSRTRVVGQGQIVREEVQPDNGVDHGVAIARSKTLVASLSLSQSGVAGVPTRVTADRPTKLYALTIRPSLGDDFDRSLASGEPCRTPKVRGV